MRRYGTQVSWLRRTISPPPQRGEAALAYMSREAEQRRGHPERKSGGTPFSSWRAVTLHFPGSSSSRSSSPGYPAVAPRLPCASLRHARSALFSVVCRPTRYLSQTHQTLHQDRLLRPPALPTPLSAMTFRPTSRERTDDLGARVGSSRDWTSETGFCPGSPPPLPRGADWLGSWKNPGAHDTNVFAGRTRHHVLGLCPL